MDGLTGVIAIARGVAVMLLLVHLGLVALTALKGKYPTAMIGIFIAPIAWWAAVRLARPTSPWARWRYSPEKLERARQRALVFDRRWGPVRRR
ncbi:integral membrane protein [Mycobacteroides abscessus subsp. massiliense]|nr:integral membrane protein [Mycobacteroides abscessus subsp. massiliense]